jgi:hypothetical protein
MLIYEKFILCSLLEQGFAYSPVSRDLRVSLIKGLAGRGFGLAEFLLL